MVPFLISTFVMAGASMTWAIGPVAVSIVIATVQCAVRTAS
ncbi:hypothetical protein ACWC2K_05535 [Streptomyces chattanoogensis]